MEVIAFNSLSFSSLYSSVLRIEWCGNDQQFYET